MLVVTLPSSAAKNPQRFAEKAKAAGADMLEIRGDLTPNIESFDSPLPILLALRKANPRLIGELKPAYLDLELGEDIGSTKGMTLIRSYHNFDRTPSFEELSDIADQLAADGDIIKIATTVTSYADYLTHERIRQKFPREKIVVLGMGPKAHLSRMLSPTRNALTYTYLDSTEEAALGQLPLSVYRQIQHCKKPRIYGIIGGMQVKKSLSPAIHNSLFNTHKEDAIFSVFPTEDLEDAFNSLAQLGVQGFSITAPWKQQVVSRLSRLDSLAERLQSVNTAIREGDDWVGCNTDMIGFIRAYPFLSECRDIAILGSGGVVPSVIAACEHLHRCRIHVFARNVSARTELEDLYHLKAHDLDDIHDHEFDAVICTISEDISIPLPEAHKHPYAIDLRYGKDTKFLRAAASKQYQTHDGLAMLIYQAMEQFKLFTNIKPIEEDRESVEELLLKSLKQRN